MKCRLENRAGEAPVPGSDPYERSPLTASQDRASDERGGRTAPTAGRLALAAADSGRTAHGNQTGTWDGQRAKLSRGDALTINDH